MSSCKTVSTIPINTRPTHSNTNQAGFCMIPKSGRVPEYDFGKINAYYVWTTSTLKTTSTQISEWRDYFPLLLPRHWLILMITLYTTL